MKHELVYVTPALAREWLKQNTDNRPLRSSKVESLRSAFERGEYLMTHQGIAFDEDGVLLDGQHRLSALALLPETFGGLHMFVTTGLPSEAFNVIDTEMSVRSASDVLRVDPTVGVVGSFMAGLVLARQKTRPTPTQIKPFADFFGPYVSELVAFCPSAAKTWSSSPVKAAAVMSMVRGHSDYAKAIYRALVLAKFDEMPPIAQAVYRASIAGSVRAAGGRDMFVRCLKVFEPNNAGLSRVQIKDASALIDAARRDIIAWMGLDAKKKAPAKLRGAKSVGADYPRVAA